MSAKNMWDNEFSTEQFVYGTAPNDFLAARFEAIPKGKVLCLADGEGRNSVFLAKHGYSVTGVDISSVAQAKGIKLAQESGVEVEFVCADLTTYDLGEQEWDGIVSISCHLPPGARKALHSKAVRALKPQGVFFMEGYTPDQLKHGTGGPPVAEMMTSKETLQGELAGLSFDFLEEVERPVVEGRNHTGIGAVVQAIASPTRAPD